MTYNNAELEELVREQIALQLKFDSNSGRIKDRTIRQRSIRDYEIELFRKNPDIYVVFEGEKRINKLLDGIREKKGKVVWADLGCGHAIALRQGKQYFEQKGALEKLAAYGYDAISANNDAIPEGLDKEGLKKDIMHEKYAPKIIKADITNVVFEEKPDIVTAVNALFWTRDPLQVFANTARQLKIGGVLCFNNMRNLHTDDIIVTNLFQKIIRYNQGLPGFKIIPTFDNSIVARKVSEQEDYTYGFRLRSRHQCIKEEPFRYTYISDLSSRGRKLEF